MAQNGVRSFKDLLVWQKAMQLVKRIYEVTALYPADEKFGLVAETRRTARSVPYNVAEGKRRRTRAEYAQFVSIGLGSLGELHTQVLLAGMLGYLASSRRDEIERDIDELGAMLFSLERSLTA